MITVQKEKGEFKATCFLGGKVCYVTKYYNGYFLYEGLKYVFAVDKQNGRKIDNITELTTGGAAVTLNEVSDKTSEAFIKKFLEKIDRAKRMGRDMKQVISDYLERVSTAEVFIAETEEFVQQVKNEKPIELWTISLLML